MRHTSWTTASNHVKPTERIYSIVDLFPGTEYQVKVTAHNNAGDTDALYNFTTTTFAGGKRCQSLRCTPSETSAISVAPELSPPVSHSGDQSFYLNAKLLVPVVSSLIISVVIFVALIYRKSKCLMFDSSKFLQV